MQGYLKHLSTKKSIIASDFCLFNNWEVEVELSLWLWSNRVVLLNSEIEKKTQILMQMKGGSQCEVGGRSQVTVLKDFQYQWSRTAFVKIRVIL